ncbi:MAG TPA: WavE lipopolysaccharide synthesis family protein [Legionella sp.]|nr:WavE lipopolysaccharide synthesis family protein [Legionella sp.]
MIADKDISIVVQGPILKDSKYNITKEITKIVCYRVKELFPDCELILSTWEGESVDGIPYDKVILNEDPQATWFDYYNHNTLNNCNRLIVSTLAGIQSATRKFVFKLRSDLFIGSKNFLNYFDKYPDYNSEFKFVGSRIIAFSMWSIQGHKTCLFTMPKPFHISDWAYFGYKEDLLELYSVPLIHEPEFSQYFLTRCKPFFDVAPNVLWKMPPEQHIITSFFKKFTTINFEHTADDSHGNMELSAKLIMNNFIVLDQTQFYLISLKHFCFQFTRQNHEWFIYHHTWLNNYLRFIDNPATLRHHLNKIGIKLRNFSVLSLYTILRMINKKQYIDRHLVKLIKKWITKNNLNYPTSNQKINENKSNIND